MSNQASEQPKDWIGNKKSTFVTLGASNHTDRPRQEHDYYATAPEAIDALHTIMPLDGLYIWEPACGGGILASVCVTLEPVLHHPISMIEVMASLA